MICRPGFSRCTPAIPPGSGSRCSSAGWPLPSQPSSSTAWSNASDGTVAALGGLAGDSHAGGDRRARAGHDGLRLRGNQPDRRRADRRDDRGRGDRPGAGCLGCLLLCRAAAESIIASPRIPEQSIDASLIRIAARVVAFLIAAWIVVDGARRLGADVVPLLAGLGVGGLAVALAAQTTLANFLGSVILFATKPVRVGDLCRYGTEIGTMEHIGLHATRIRTFERSIVSVPNAAFSQMQLDNLSRRDQRLCTTVLQLRYETSPKQLRWILAKLREMLVAHPLVDPGRPAFASSPSARTRRMSRSRVYLQCQDQNRSSPSRRTCCCASMTSSPRRAVASPSPPRRPIWRSDGGLERRAIGRGGGRGRGLAGRGRAPLPEIAGGEVGRSTPTRPEALPIEACRAEGAPRSWSRSGPAVAAAR